MHIAMEKAKGVHKGASFIKLLGPDFSDELQLPQDFTDTFNGCVPHRVFIESSMPKKCWRVEVEKDEDRLFYFRDGWGAFTKAHCLEVGNILLFENVEQSIFHVKMYNQNGCEIKIFDSPKESQPSPPSQPIPPKVIDIEEEKYCESHKREPKVLRKNPRERTRTLLSMHKDSNGFYKKHHVCPKTRLCNTGENKASFSVLMAKDHQFIQLEIPITVSLEQKLASKKKLVLQDDKGNSWQVDLGHSKTGSALLSGWTNFLNGNNIVLGDILNFDFISDKEARVNVTRSSEQKCHSKDTRSFRIDPNRVQCSMPQGNHTAKDQTVEAPITTKKVDSKHKRSTFSVTWGKTKALTYLHIPKAIAQEQKLKNKECVALQDTNGKYWPLEVKIWNNGQVGFTQGWADFWRGLTIKNGDTLELEFVSSRRIQVSIHRREPHQLQANAKEAIDVEGIDIKEPNNDQFASTIEREAMNIKGHASDPLDSSFDEEMMDVKGFADDLLNSNFLQTPPGFKPMKHHLL